MIIIWSGLGFLVPVLAFAGVLVSQVAVNAATHDDQFYQSHGWPKLLGVCIASAVIWPLGRALNRGTERELFDPQTGELVVLRSGGGHTLFFLPFEYWAIVGLVFGIVLTATK